jgi:hypothetical protein
MPIWALSLPTFHCRYHHQYVCPQAIAIGQRAMRGRDPEAVMEDLGFGELQLVSSFSVTMSGTRLGKSIHLPRRVLRCIC